ncbi:MAG TPA: hypothetical protein PKO25_13995, partial [Spirochaetota bacterium]|nr:hypothetical protein [Spirochaetota bacterium]
MGIRAFRGHGRGWVSVLSRGMGVDGYPCFQGAWARMGIRAFRGHGRGWVSVLSGGMGADGYPC